MSIERRAISALKWATAAKLAVQVVSWAGTLLVVRLLSPEDYGLMAKVAVVCAIGSAVAELGLEAAIVRWGDLAREDVRKIYGVSLLFSAGVTLLVAAASPLVAFLFREPKLTWPVAVASLQIMISAFAIVPGGLWTRELNFKPLATIEVLVGVINIGVTLLLALLGLGVKFGLTLVGNRVSYIALVQSDVMIGSAFLSTTEIGQYAVALQLATLPMAKVMGTINQILLPAVARQQDDLPRVRLNLLKSIGLVSTMAFPALWGISAVAGELVHVLFGHKWEAIVPALAILPLIVPVRMACTLLYTTSLALGNRTLDLRNTIINFVLLPAGFYVGAHWGVIGLCVAWLVTVPVAYSFTVPAVVRFIGLRARDLSSECLAPAAAAGIMYAGVAALRGVASALPDILALAALSAGGAILYFVALALISRRHLLAVGQFIRSMRGGYTLPAS